MKGLQDYPTITDYSTIKKSRAESFQGIASRAKSQPFVPMSFLTIAVVWISWLLLQGPINAFTNLISYWEIALTMVFGSLVAGSTSMGGGAVAFPVLTKVLAIVPYQAKVFSLAIQTVGMGAASLTIIGMGTPLPWRLIGMASLGGIPGIWLGTAVLSPILPPDTTRFLFTMMLASFGIILLVFREAQSNRKLAIDTWNQQAKVIVLGAGFLGGIVSGLVGSGMDIVLFSVLVLLFNLCERLSTPTSVVLMAINAAVGFFLHQFVIGDFVAPVQNYWLAAVPVVVCGASAGAVICSFLSRQMILRILVTLIGIELLTSFLLIPLTLSTIGLGSLVFTLFCSIYYQMHHTKLTP